MRSLLIAITGFCALSPLAAAQGADLRKLSARGIHELLVENDLGQVAIDGSANAGTIEIHADRFSVPEYCELTTEQHGKQLRIVARAKNPQTTRDQCKVNIAVKAPRNIDLDVKVGSGALSARGFEGSMRFDIGNGDIKLSEIKTRDLSGRAGTGDVMIDGQIAQAELKVGAGNVQLTYDRVPGEAAGSPGSLNIKVGSGSTTVLLPEHARVQTSFRSGAGSLTNEFPHHDNAKFTISGTSGAGDMFIRKQ